MSAGWPLRWVAAAALCLGLGAGLGCNGTTPGPKTPTEGQPALVAVAVSETDFASAVHRLLREGDATPERSALLAGVVRHQLSHAAEHFARGNDERGTAAVVGALYLMRVGERRADMYDEDSAAAFEGAVRRFSARGDEGRAMALMAMLADLLPKESPRRAALERHMKSLERWMNDTRTGGDMTRLAADERSAVGRALLEPSDDALTAAARAIDKWILRAVEYNVLYQRTKQLPPRDEVTEAYRALQSGGESMAALFLRYGRAREALSVIDGSAAGRIASPSFFARLRAVAMDDTAEDWRLLARDFARMTFDEDGTMIDLELVHAALWGIAVEAYRRDPTSLAIGHLLADKLVDLGMPEVAPLVLGDALGSQPSAVSLSAVTSALAASLSEQYEAGTVDTARRIFSASRAVLELADQPRYLGKVKPTSAELRQLMAGIELRAGDFAAARPLLLRSLEAEPTVWGYTMLATLERQVGELDSALAHVGEATKLPEAQALPLEVAEAKLLAFEIFRERGAKEGAEEALGEALEITLASRKRGSAEALVRAERLLARALDGYGQRKGASRAIDRALEIAGNHQQMLGGTVLSAVGRALVYKDIGGARAALQVGIKANLDPEDLVYGALWLMFLEQELGESPDGKVDRVLLDAIQGSAWTNALARWAREMIDDEALRKAASNHSEKVEAEFYISMRQRIAGKAEADDKLRQVANNPLIELMEVQIARDLLAPRIDTPIPPNVALP